MERYHAHVERQSCKYIQYVPQLLCKLHAIPVKENMVVFHRNWHTRAKIQIKEWKAKKSQENSEEEKRVCVYVCAVGRDYDLGIENDFFKDKTEHEGKTDKHDI